MKLGYKIDGGRLIIVMEGDFHNYDDAGRKKEMYLPLFLTERGWGNGIQRWRFFCLMC